jgi:hypothetical protein
MNKSSTEFQETLVQSENYKKLAEAIIDYLKKKEAVNKIYIYQI